MDQEKSEKKEGQQIKEWHKEVFKDIKNNNYECLSKEDIQI